MMAHLLTIVLVILKATGFISWSWWLVFAPSIIAGVLGLVLLAGAFFIMLKQ